MNFLSDDVIREKLKWPEVLATLEQAFAARYKNPKAFILPERVAISVNKATYLTMPCADQEGWFGVKQVSVIPDNPSIGKPSVQAWYTLFDPTGTPTLACSATFLTKLRTSAVSAIASQYLSRPDAKTLLVIGTGSLAPWMAEAHAQVHDYKKILVWGRNLEKVKNTIQDVQQRLEISIEETSVVKKISVEAIANLEDGIKQAEVITVATTSRTPIIKGEWLKSGQHIDLVGAFIPEMLEVDAETIKRSSVFVDDLEACKAEAGDLIQAQASDWSFDQVEGDLAKLVVENPNRGEVTLFKSVGLALEDLVVAKLLV
jgi:ornithine cyclodeaminase/alanine dehydrogenase-like protein (mu-crystallin family)